MANLLFILPLTWTGGAVTLDASVVSRIDDYRWFVLLVSFWHIDILGQDRREEKVK